ncbi:MAG: O-sialoglycoprotein endopeptidase [Negativicutes bacterium]|nr:O-sialoglycoprotein endopeptidase [Negativicutes bacterium]
MNAYLGIDTSCYTTSLALLAGDGAVLADLRKPLNVKLGGRGLSQSEMVFQHTRNLPALFEELYGKQAFSVRAIGVSVAPRSQSDSYMPAFLTGEGYARALAAATGAALYRLSHQENHILAGLRSAGGPNSDTFLAVHMSGGTTEIVKITYAENCVVELLGGTMDLHAGQFVDRIGVALGLPFPAGPHMERLASTASYAADLPVSVHGLRISLSGPETQALRLISRNEDPAAIAAGVEQCIAESASRMIQAALDSTSLRDVLVVGGVAANSHIRNYLQRKLAVYGVNLFFPDSRYSSDNATGAAFLACRCSTNLNAPA